MAFTQLLVLAQISLGAFAASLPMLVERAQSALPFNWSYAGCKVDVGDRILYENHIITSAMTPQVCVSACASLGYSMAGVEYGEECWCGNAYNQNVGPVVSAAENECSFTCPGDGSQTCGAGWRIQVYNAYATGKRGLAWPSDNNFDPVVFKSHAVSWLYGWGRINPAKNHDFPFYITQWNAAGIETLGAAAVATGAKTVLAFNEPDSDRQAAMSPEVAAQYYKQYIHPMATDGYKLISPAVTNGGAPWGIAWMDAFLAACTGCTIDAIGIHWYGGWVDDLKSFVESAKKYNKPLYLSEFGLAWDAAASNYAEFLPLALQYLDSEPAIAKYAFFGAFHSGGGWDMLAADGSLTDLGRIYVS